jgi:3-isopropylmalate/(R)-2-methylmalate dehydratase small subunit
MERVVVVTHRAVPLDRTGVDTDQIIPSDSFRSGGTTATSSQHPGGRAQFCHRLVTWARSLGPDGLRLPGRDVVALGRHLPQHLHQAGTLAGAGVTGVRPLLTAVAADPSLEITIDVTRATIEAPAAGMAHTFPLDEFTRQRLLNEWENIALSLHHVDDITAYEKRRPSFLPSA